jgi:TetR/AcrR family transcriptional regulator
VPASSRTGNEPVARRAGRPRRNGQVVVEEPADAILGAAAVLFGELGVSGTTMARLAAEVGLGQSSVYYYFASRDDVVAALVARANVVSLDLVDAVAASDAPPPVKLLQFVRGDVEALCALPFDINEVHRIAARDRRRFSRYWRERDHLADRLGAIVRAGMADGTFRTVDPALTALTVMANDEGVQNWYRLGTRRRPAVVAQSVAELTVGGLLAPGTHVSDVVAATVRSR